MKKAMNGKSNFHEACREGSSSAENDPGLIEMKCIREPASLKGSILSSEERLAYVTCIEWRQKCFHKSGTTENISVS